MKKSAAFRRKKPHRVSDPNALAEVRELLSDSPREREYLIEFLHCIQDRYGHISAKHLNALAIEMRLSIADVYETATFYHHFDILQEGDSPPPPITVRVCESISCAMAGAHELLENLENKAPKGVRILRAPCVGRCADAPVAVVGQRPVVAATREKIEQILATNQFHCPVPSAINYAAYRECGGYELWVDCMKGQHDREHIITLLEHSELRGLGGAGFPAGRKWRILKDQPAPRFIAINIDEGEPGTFKDRHYLESEPHRFIEGALIAAWTIKSEHIYIYLRDEYAGCREFLEQELAALKASPPISPLPSISLRRGAGAYICGEESAMIESIEGKKGMPRLRPPYVAQFGLFGRPTLEHNMETLHWVREIIEKGSEWFVSHGRRGRKGLRSFSVSGRVKKPGVHVAPAGISVNELIDEHCGGMQDGHEFYAYFPGGASGGILPASLGNEPLDFDTLQKHGCFIGSAAIIILSRTDRVRDMALNAMRFFEDESCGQCTPCRVGTAKAVLLMERNQWDLPLLEELAHCMEDASICGLGQAAPNPLRCAIRYFPEEFS
ncbi:MAG: NAD(P)H-dependent oxidoreductase subunit E [Candidatus Eutrophobiaceae bacterium]